MPPTTIRNAPSLDAFTALADHQAQTPSTFYGAKPVLHYHATGTRALTSRDRLSKLPIFPSDASGQSESRPTETEAGAEAAAPERLVVEVVDAFISSENLTLFNTATSTGISIPYPAISLHAIQRLDDPIDSSQQVQGLYMQLELSDPFGVTDDDEDLDIVELTLIPPRNPETGSIDIQALFDAISSCSNLHPDPAFQDDEEMEDADGDSRIMFEGNVGYEGISGLPGVQQGALDGGLPPPFPGSGGWITAENVSEYFDEDGNWIGEGAEDGGQTLGEGAGRIRTRDEMDGDGVNGNGHRDSDESKRPRTERTD